MTDFTVVAIGTVANARNEAIDDDWDSVTSTITLDETQFDAASLQGLEAFSHIEVVFVFDRVAPGAVQNGVRHPRGNKDWPEVGIFAQRAKGRPNRIGVTVCRLLSLDGLSLTVQALDAIDGTPVIDIKPYMQEFGPRGDVQQPRWASQLMTSYWSAPDR